MTDANGGELSEDGLSRYLSGEATPAEVQAAEAWLGSTPARAEAMAALHHFLRTTGPQVADEQVRDTERQFLHLVQAGERKYAVKKPLGLTGRGSTAGVRGASTLRKGIGAAMFACLATIAGVMWMRSPSYPPSYTAYTTNTGQTKVITLGDGSRVTLAPESELRMASTFGRDSRMVMLRGAAYFEVRTATGSPFIVQTGGVSTRVLGTKFVVRRYASADPARVAVMSGRVVARGGRQAVLLDAGHVADATDSTAVPLDVPAESSMRWTQGQLVFDGTPVRALLAEVSRWYGYSFRLDDSTLMSRHVTTTLSVSDTSDMMLKVSSVLNVTMKLDGKTITLQPRRLLRKAPARGQQDFTTPITEKGR